MSNANPLTEAVVFGLVIALAFVPLLRAFGGR